METAAARLREVVTAARFPIDIGQAAQARAEQGSLRHQLDDYILPRLASVEAPMLVVVGGSTGSGKSTLVNSIVGDAVSAAGVLRPTTRSPVLVHHRDDREWFAAKVLPRLSRITGAVTPEGDRDMGSVRLVESDALPPGLALLDAPDVDSVVEANRELARQLLSAADLWLFVTTAARYADAVPWELLRQAGERGTSVAIVLDRVPSAAAAEIRTDLAGMLADQGLGGAPIFTVREVVLEDSGRLPEEEVGAIRRWLTVLAQDSAARRAIVRKTLTGALDSLRDRVDVLVQASREQASAADALRAVPREAFADAATSVEEGVSDGTLLRGEVLARWQEFVGTGEFLKSVEAGVSRLRDRITSAFRGAPTPQAELGEVLESGVSTLIRANGDRAASMTMRGWRSLPGGEALVDRLPGGAVLAADLPERTDRLVRDWQGDLLDLVRSEGKDRRTAARVMAYGVNGLGVVLMIAIFASTAGIPTGAEVGVAGGSAVVAQKILEAIFGDQAVRNLAGKARRNLFGRVESLYGQELARMEALVDAVDVGDGQAADLAAAAVAVKAAR